MAQFRTLDSAAVQAILAAFGLSGYRAHRPIAAGTINTNVRVETDDRVLFLRVNEGKSKAEVEYEAAVVAHAASWGVPTPPPLMAVDGRPFAVWNHLYVSFFPWNEGHTLTRDQVTPAHAAAAGRALAVLHRAGESFPDRRSGRYEPDEIQRRLARIALVDDPSLRPAVVELARELEQLEEERHPDLPLGLIHGDLFIDNVLFEDAHLTAVLDFEQASWGRLAYDVAVAVLAFGYGRDDFRVDVTRALLDGYRSERVPTRAEGSHFGAELRFAACRFAVTRITDVYLRRSQGAPAGKDFRRYLARLASLRAHEHAQPEWLRL